MRISRPVSSKSKTPQFRPRARSVAVSFLLDANAVVALFEGRSRFTRELKRHRPAGVSLPSVVVHELYFGAYASKRVGENVARIERLRFEILAFDDEDARVAGRIRAELRAAGSPIGPLDVLIAGQAVSRGRTLVTDNVARFQRVDGLEIVNWLRP